MLAAGYTQNQNRHSVRMHMHSTLTPLLQREMHRDRHEIQSIGNSISVKIF